MLTFISVGFLSFLWNWYVGSPLQIGYWAHKYVVAVQTPLRSIKLLKKIYIGDIGGLRVNASLMNVMFKHNFWLLECLVHLYAAEILIAAHSLYVVHMLYTYGVPQNEFDFIYYLLALCVYRVASNIFEFCFLRNEILRYVSELYD